MSAKAQLPIGRASEKITGALTMPVRHFFSGGLQSHFTNIHLTRLIAIVGAAVSPDVTQR
jgi:hypothetical protein